MPVRRMVLGVQAGVIAGLVFLSLCAFFSVLSRDAWWWTANVYGSSFYGPRSLRWGLGWITLAGTALQVVLSGLAGALFGLLPPFESRRTALLAGASFGLIGHYLGAVTFWHWVNPWVPYYLSGAGHVVLAAAFGLCLGSLHAVVPVVPPAIPAPPPEPEIAVPPPIPEPDPLPNSVPDPPEPSARVE